MDARDWWLTTELREAVAARLAPSPLIPTDGLLPGVWIGVDPAQGSGLREFSAIDRRRYYATVLALHVRRMRAARGVPWFRRWTRRLLVRMHHGRTILLRLAFESLGGGATTRNTGAQGL